MRIPLLLCVFAAAAILQMPLSVEAFECPTHFKEAQAAIDEATKALKSLKKGSPLFRIVHAAIDDAKMCLFGAKHNHAKPQGDFDHARAIAKAVFSKAFAQQCLKIPHQSLRYSSALPPMFLGSMTKYAGAFSSGNLSL